MITIHAPAKINLFLRVLGRRADGFHDLETAFCAISLADTVAVAESPSGTGITLRVDGDPPTHDPEENLVMRAARRFERGTGRALDVEIHLEKRIPAAAGLGGGSSDAAATLLALNALRPDPVDAARILEWGAELGSDVPFFLCGSSCALAWGRGERLLALPPLPRKPIVIAHPGVPIPTGEAFRDIARGRGDGYHVPGAAMRYHDFAAWNRLARLAHNDFEAPAIARVPKIADAIRAFRAAGASIAMLAGSGASVYAVYDDEPSAEEGARAAERLGFRAWRAWTLAD